MSKYTKLRELEARATSGPWVTYDARSHVQALDGSLAVVCHYGNTDRPFSDAALISATRNALPGLLDELEAARKLLRLLEWYGDDEPVSCCLICGGGQPDHAPDCGLAVWLAGDP